MEIVFILLVIIGNDLRFNTNFNYYGSPAAGTYPKWRILRPLFMDPSMDYYRFSPWFLVNTLKI
jgi:hypothetical protein